MESVLIEGWMGGLDRLAIRDEASISLVRQAVRHAADALGLPVEASASLSTVASELGHNQLAHARRGVMGIRTIEAGGVPGLEVVAADAGSGILDPKTALRGAERRTSGSLGIGLAAARELSDEMDFDVRTGEGTCIRARKFGAAVPRRREVGIFGRPCVGEHVSGDHAGFVREGSVLHATLADGLGHGIPARDAAHAVIAALLGHTGDFVRAFELADAAARGSRGAVVSAVSLDPQRGEVVAASLGNVALRFVSPRRARRIGGTEGFVGATGQRLRPRVEREPIEPREVVLMFTDGVSSRASIEEDFDLLREPAIVIAWEVARRFGRDHDDILVLVAR